MMGHALGIKHLRSNPYLCIRYNSSHMRLGWPTKGVKGSTSAFSAFKSRIGKALCVSPSPSVLGFMERYACMVRRVAISCLLHDIVLKIGTCTSDYLKTSWTPRVVALVDAQVVILLGFVALQGYSILHSCAVKIMHTITKFLLLNIFSLEIGFSRVKVVTSGNLAILYKRGLRSKVKVRNSEYTF